MQSQCEKNDWIGMLRMHYIAFLFVMCFPQNGMKKENPQALLKSALLNKEQCQIVTCTSPFWLFVE